METLASLWPHESLGCGLLQQLSILGLAHLDAYQCHLVGASVPVFMLAMGAVFYKQSVSARQVLGAAMSIAGVLCVLGRGDWETLQKCNW